MPKILFAKAQIHLGHVFYFCELLEQRPRVLARLETPLYTVFPNQCKVVFSQLGKETKSYNKKKITESKTNKKRYEK